MQPHLYLSKLCHSSVNHYVNAVHLFMGVMVFNATFKQHFSFIVAVSFIGGGIRSTLRNTDLSQVADKLYHIMLYRIFELTT